MGRRRDERRAAASLGGELTLVSLEQVHCCISARSKPLLPNRQRSRLGSHCQKESDSSRYAWVQRKIQMAQPQMQTAMG